MAFRSAVWRLRVENKFDVIVIGGGPGGYTAAIHASKFGLRTALIEDEKLGGTCLNRGCIPTKAMLHTAELMRQIGSCDQFGVHVEGARLDYAQMLAYRECTVESLKNGIASLLKSVGVTCITGRGQLLPGNRVLVTSPDRETELHGTNIILAAGSRPKKIPVPGVDLSNVLTSDGILELDRLPESLTIVGGGAIGVEFAEVFSAMGTAVTLIEVQQRLLPGMDRDFSQNLRPLLKKRGVDVHLGVMIQEIRQEGNCLVCHFTENERELTAHSEYVLCAVGRAPNTEGLFATNAQPELTPTGHVMVNEKLMTSLDRVYAIGDLIPGPQLAHAASTQGRTAAELIAGRTPTADLNLIPACVYTTPEIAQVGLTEQSAREAGIAVRTAKIPMAANPRSQIARSERGFLKIISNAQNSSILGAQLMCDRATDMVGEFVLAVAKHWTVRDMQRIIRPHPTYEESVTDLAELYAQIS